MRLRSVDTIAMSSAQPEISMDESNEETDDDGMKPTHPDQRDETGRWEESYTLDMFRSFLAEHPDSSTTDVADGIGVVYKTAYRKMRELQEIGHVESRRAANAHLWSLSEEGQKVHAEEAEEGEDR